MIDRLDDWLVINDNVELTPAIEKSILAVRPHFALHQHKAYVTSGLRSPERQVFDAIYSNSIRAKLDMVYPEFRTGLSGHWLIDKKVSTPEGQLFWWQRTWSKLLNCGYIVNPPIDAVCLYHSFRDNGTDRKGVVIHASPHSGGRAYDIGGGSDRKPNDEYAILLEAQKDPLCRITSLTLETMNNCVHVNVSA